MKYFFFTPPPPLASSGGDENVMLPFLWFPWRCHGVVVVTSQGGSSLVRPMCDKLVVVGYNNSIIYFI